MGLSRTVFEINDNFGRKKKKHIFLNNVFNAPVESAAFRTSLTAFGLKEKLK